MPRVISFGDHVRVLATPLTESAGLAGLVGTVHGETAPSVTSVEVIGDLVSDRALAVHFEERGSALWLAPDLLEFADHAPGTVITLEGIPKRWVRSANGEWVEESTQPPTASRKAWWKLW